MGRGRRRVTAEVVADAVVVRKGEFRVPSLEASFDMVLVNSLLSLLCFQSSNRSPAARDTGGCTVEYKLVSKSILVRDAPRELCPRRR